MTPVQRVRAQRAEAAFRVAQSAYMSAFAEANGIGIGDESREHLFEIERLLQKVQRRLREVIDGRGEDQ